MRVHRTLLLATATIILALSFGATDGIASESLEFSPIEEEIRETARATTFEAGGMTVICETILRKSFHQRVRKVRGTLAGFITSATLANCVEGERRIDVRFLGPPWHIRYESFGGTLPLISSVLLRIFEVEVLIAFPFLNCLYRGSVGFEMTIVSGRAARLVVLAGQTIPVSRQILTSALCPASLAIAALFTIESPLSVRLL